MARGRVMSRIQVGTRTRGPVAGGRLEKAAWNGDRHGGGRWRHKVQLCVPVTGHKQLALVFIRGWVRSRGLRRCRQALEVKLVRVPLPVDLRHDVLVVVVPGSRYGYLDATWMREDYISRMINENYLD